MKAICRMTGLALFLLACRPDSVSSHRETAVSNSQFLQIPQNSSNVSSTTIAWLADLRLHPQAVELTEREALEIDSSTLSSIGRTQNRRGSRGRVLEREKRA